jgi:hypothetical protein
LHQNLNDMRIASAKYLNDYSIEIQFLDGRVVVADFYEFLKKSKNPMTSKFLDKDLFKNVEVDNGFLSWNNGEMEIPADSIANYCSAKPKRVSATKHKQKV